MIILLLLLSFVIDIEAQVGRPSNFGIPMTSVRQAVGGAPPVDITTGMVAYWRFNEGSGLNIADSSGHGNSLQYYNTPSIPSIFFTPSYNASQSFAFTNTGGNGLVNAISTAGVPAYVGVGTPPTCSYSFWVKVQPTSSGYLYAEASSAHPLTDLRFSFDASNKFHIDANSDSVSGVINRSFATPVTASWHHIAVVFDNNATQTRMTVYIDGVPDVPYTTSYNDFTSNEAVVGSDWLVSQGNYLLDEFRVYNIALNQAQVNALYDFDLTTGLSAYLKFDESSGNTASDSSGNGNTFTFGQGTPVWSTSGATNNCWNNSAGSGAFTNLMVNKLPVCNNVSGFSISMWVNATVTNATQYFYTEQLSTGSNPLFSIISGASTRAQVTIRDASGTSILSQLSNGALYATNQWHHIAFTAGPEGIAKLYIDGIQDPTNFNYNSSTIPSLDESTIGGYLNAGSTIFQLKASIDETRLYKIPLSAKQVQALYALGPPVDVTTGLVGYWKYDEASGTTAADSSGNNDNGAYTANGATIFNPVGGHLNGCFTNTSTFGYITNIIGKGLPVYITNLNWSVSCWLRSQASVTSGGFYYGEACTTTQGYLLLQMSSGGNAVVNIRTDSGSFGLTSFTSTKTIGDNTWHHVVVTGSNTGIVVIYIDGMQDKSTSYTVAPATINTSSSAGYTTSTAHTSYTGAIDELRTYNIMLNPLQVNMLYKSY